MKRRRSSQARDPLSPTSRRLLAGCVLLLAAPLVVTAAFMVPAAMSSYQTQVFLAHWRSTGTEPHAQAYRVAHQAAQRSVSLYPVANGRYLAQLGLVEQWQMFRRPFGDPAAAPSRRASLEHLRQAAAARPTWPAGWIDLAWSKAYLLEFDSEFDNALQQATQHGPWRIGVNRSLSELGLLSWPYLAPRQRMLVLESARRTVAHSARQAQALFKSAEANGRAETLCTALPNPLAQDRRICAAPSAEG